MKLENVVVVKTTAYAIDFEPATTFFVEYANEKPGMEALMHKYAVHLLFLLASCLRVFEQVKKPGLLRHVLEGMLPPKYENVEKTEARARF